MTRSVWDPGIFERLLESKQRELGDLQEKLRSLPLDSPLRLQLLEQMLHLQETIPELEAEYARKTAVEPHNSTADLAAHGGVEIRPIVDDHPLSLAQCAVCTHYRFE